MSNSLYKTQNIVITGGPGTGKTSLINALQKQGYTTYREQAIDLIDEMISEWGIHYFIEWKKKNRMIFNSMILARQLAFESNLNDASIRFFDRGHLDPLAYLDKFQQKALIKRYFEAYQAQVRQGTIIPYHLVFQCEPLSQFDTRFETGRTESEQESALLGKKLHAIYQKHGFEVIKLPADSIENRIAIISDAMVPEQQCKHI